ncbi:cytochrome P450 2G1 isoform X2 [Anolis carolinensis]|uniref:cytochrome P450 2G1 isoform X2 n=1 Tax=Anolis carolinensis TaxID=28377 RepID=UPI0004624A89|nr:PREDICTED: cytochrome P450 2G1 isoform X1 [Anolis carolinensis]|eukprot:XP_008112048.1 PREDICTED: cytochrome P450 2G1 isoform X1 [Anolis carolinensis]
MMEWTVSVTFFLVVFISFYLLLSSKRKRLHKKKLPPGPTPLPLIGNFLQIKSSETLKSLLKIRDKYGPVFTVYFGSRPVLVLCGHDAVKEALIDKAEQFSGRITTPIFEQTFQQYGVVFANGERWKQLRRFSLTILKNFGMGRKSIEERIQEEAQFLLEEFQKTKEKPFEPSSFLSRAVSNIICSIVFGDRFDYEDKEFQSLMEMIHNAFQEMSSTWSQEKGNPDSGFDIKNLELTTLCLFFGGTETVSSTLRYGFLLLMKYPKVQAKVHDEIDRVIGHNRIPNIEDRSQMPYTDAVIHEIQRFSDLLPMSVAHMVTCDTEFRGYFIPKGMIVYPMLTSVLHDPTMFKSPNVFNPENFLDENGRFKTNDAFVPFSSGKRICLGESLARMELFIFFTTILQSFYLKSLVPPEDIDITPQECGFATIAPLYQLSIIPRRA